MKTQWYYPCHQTSPGTYSFMSDNDYHIVYTFFLDFPCSGYKDGYATMGYNCSILVVTAPDLVVICTVQFNVLLQL